jgi:hypothetical protein
MDFLGVVQLRQATQLSFAFRTLIDEFASPNVHLAMQVGWISGGDFNHFHGNALSDEESNFG